MRQFLPQKAYFHGEKWYLKALKQPKALYPIRKKVYLRAWNEPSRQMRHLSQSHFVEKFSLGLPRACMQEQSLELITVLPRLVRKRTIKLMRFFD